MFAPNVSAVTTRPTKADHAAYKVTSPISIGQGGAK
jgi:hypothetical protein